jgi:hypothetical protein
MTGVPKKINYASPTSRGLAKFDSNMFTVLRGLVQSDSSYTAEIVEDVIGGMVTGNTETFISVTYDDAGGKLNFVVPVKDEDDMASNSVSYLATQQSIKAYVDNTFANIYSNIDGGDADDVYGGIVVSPLDCGGA